MTIDKTTPISSHRAKDLKLLRKKLLGIIEDENSKAKDITDASKLLARLHHALQIEKITKAPLDTKKERELSPKEMEQVHNILNES